MRESRTYGSARGAWGNPRPYRDRFRHPASTSGVPQLAAGIAAARKSAALCQKLPFSGVDFLARMKESGFCALMRHQQILDKLSASRDLVRAMDEDLARWTGEVMTGSRGLHIDVAQQLLPPVMARWRCLLDAGNAHVHTKNIAWVALATLLHRYGFRDKHITAKALTAIDDLNKDVVLSDAFARQSKATKAFLQSTPKQLTRRPQRPKPETFLRVGDVVSIELNRYFHPAFVLALHRDRGGTFPVIEFYEGRFKHIPAPEDLSGRAMAREYGRGRFGVIGLKYLPDPANQVTAIAAGHADPPRGAPPKAQHGQWILTDLMRLQDYITELYGAAHMRDQRSS
jgi:hypothetical protein